MTGDCHVRICGSPGVRFPRATRPYSSTNKHLSGYPRANTWEEAERIIRASLLKWSEEK